MVALRKTRLSARRSERGAAVFLVVMVLTLVTAIGVFSMRSASLVNLATGFNRQGVQATAVAEYGARAAATTLGDFAAILDDPESVTGCAPALLAQNPNAYCKVFKDVLLSQLFSASAPQSFADGLYGQLSLPGEPTVIRAEFATELTEPAPISVLATPGNPSGNFRQVTLTARARVYPTDTATTNICSAGARTALSERVVRAHVSVRKQ